MLMEKGKLLRAPRFCPVQAFKPVRFCQFVFMSLSFRGSVIFIFQHGSADWSSSTGHAPRVPHL